MPYRFGEYWRIDINKDKYILFVSYEEAMEYIND